MNRHAPHSLFTFDESFSIIASTTLGLLSIEVSRAGISQVDFVTSRGRGPKEVSCSDELITLMSVVTEAIENPLSAANLTLHIQGTPFQCSVWRYLQTIPAGTTRTYAEIARALGAPRSYRAVANACGANRIAILIPCHRAIRSDGSHGGYRWGAERKKEILEHELRCSQKQTRSPVRSIRAIDPMTDTASGRMASSCVLVKT